MIRTLCLALGLLLASTCFAADDPADGGDVLGRRVGTWDNATTIKPGVWVPDGSKTTAVETIRWVLDKNFIEGSNRGTGDGNSLTTTHLMRYDAETKTFHMWYFASDGSFPQAETSGKWDAAKQTLNLSAVLPDGVVSKVFLQLVDADHVHWGGTWTDKDGKILLEIDATQTRRAGGAGDKQITPTVDTGPGAQAPMRLKWLAPFIGAWTSELRNNLDTDPAWKPGDANVKTWTLGGRFLRDEVRNANGDLTMLGLWTYDDGQKKFREWYFTAAGDVLDITADASEAAKDLTLNLAGKMLHGNTLSGVQNVTGPDTYTWDARIQDDTGKIVGNLSGRLKRK